jgi:hypothetical protein
VVPPGSQEGLERATSHQQAGAACLYPVLEFMPILAGPGAGFFSD